MIKKDYTLTKTLTMDTVLSSLRGKISYKKGAMSAVEIIDILGYLLMQIDNSEKHHDLILEYMGKVMAHGLSMNTSDHLEYLNKLIDL